jgi:Predicted oxidoreductases of the aldo/keto reductase family
MSAKQASDKSQLLSDLPPYIYGTTRLGDEKIPFDERVSVARAAMEGVDWFHTSHTYGNAPQVLRAAFDQDRTRVPKLIVKIGWSHLDELRDVIHQNIDPLGLDGLEVGQLCLSGELAEAYANGGKCYETFSQIKQEGLVHRFVLEVFPWTSDVALKALRGGYPEGIVDGYIFYLNPLQRFASNELWHMLVGRDEPIIAMRTVAGGNIYKLRDVPGYAWKEYLQQRAVEVAPIFERSGIQSWTEFCVRFAHSFPQVRATVGATSHIENLNQFLIASENIELLPKDIQDEMIQLQYRWSEELDMKAEQWTM